jgi:hypothetical protein
MNWKTLLIILGFTFFLTFLFYGCDPGSPVSTVGDPSTCEGCHTNETTLKKYASSDSTTNGGGGG